VVGADTLLLRAYHGTVSKVSISTECGQTTPEALIPLRFRQFGLTLADLRVNLALTVDSAPEEEFP
jgi:hypothetical protein